MKILIFLTLFSSMAFADYQYGGLSNNQLCRVDAANTWSIGGQVINNSQQSVVPLTIASTTGQIANLFNITSSAGTVLASVDKLGRFIGDGSQLSNMSGGSVTSVFSRTGIVTSSNNDYSWNQIDKTISSLNDITTRKITTASAAGVGLTISSTVAQTANLLEFRDSSTTVLSYVNSFGEMYSKFAYVTDQKSASDGGGCTAGQQFRDLTTVQDNGTGITISSNAMVVPAGTWAAEFECNGFSVLNRFQCELYNSTDSAEVSASCVGTAENEDSGSSSITSHIRCIFTLATPKNIKIRAYCQTSVASVGFGRRVENFSGYLTNIYTSGKMTKVP